MSSTIQDEPLDLSISASSSTTTNQLSDEQIQMAMVEMYTQLMNEQIVAMFESMKKETIEKEEEEEMMEEEPLIVVDVEDDNLHYVGVDDQHSKKREIKKPPSQKKSRFLEKRCEANARERNRVQQLSKMFDQLRICLPLQDELKISKLSTLRVATAYIDFLASLLNNPKDNNSKSRLTKELESAKTLRR